MNNPILLIVNSLRDELTCALCQDVFENPQSAIPCLHTFCLDCVCSIPNEEGTFACPICRSAVNHYVNNYSTQNFLDIFKKAQDYYEGQNTPTEIIESLNIDNHSAGSSSSSVQLISANDANIKRPCRSCQPSNGTNFICSIPISSDEQTGFGHIFCGFCSEYLPARGPKGNEPAINQCCSFCGIVACDKYWGCKNRDMAAKLYVLSEITSIKQYLVDIERIDSLEDGHLNQYEIRLLEEYLERSHLSWSEAWSTCLNDFNDNHYTTGIARRMTPLALQLYNTRRLETESNHDEEEEEDTYYDRMGEEGILPSNHLLACYSCAVTIVNGQFYGYWRDALANGLARAVLQVDLRDPCPQGALCESQWRTETHARRLCHIETSEYNSSVVSNRTSNEFYEFYDA